MQVQRSPKINELIEKIEPLVQSQGLSLRDIELLGGSRNCIVRVIIDRPLTSNSHQNEGHDQVGIEDCVLVHRLLGPSFDVWDPFPHAYTLEVVSPGEKPPLRKFEHFQQALGGTIEFETQVPIELAPPSKPRKNWKSKLISLSPEKGTITVEDHLGQFELPLNQVSNATWLREWTV
jgi:ribosome maturation factor RimP